MFYILSCISFFKPQKKKEMEKNKRYLFFYSTVRKRKIHEKKKDSSTKAQTLISKTSIFNLTAQDFKSGTYLSTS